MLLLWNHLDSWNQTAKEWSLEGPLQILVFYADRKSKMATTAIHRLTLDPMGKCSNAFFSETTNIIKAKLYMNVHWMVLYKLYVFCSDKKFKMAATAGLSFIIGPYGKNVSKCFFSETTWIIETKLPRNDHWKVIYKVSVFLCRSEIQDGRHRRT